MSSGLPILGVTVPSSSRTYEDWEQSGSAPIWQWGPLGDFIHQAHSRGDSRGSGVERFTTRTGRRAVRSMTGMNRAASLLMAGALICLNAAAAAAANSIQVENAKPGTTEWQLTGHSYASGTIEGYASLTSVNRGGEISLFVTTTESTYTMDIFRMGYYGGAGGRRMLATITRAGVAQPACPTDSATGLIECQWIDPYVLTIPNTADPT